MDAQRFREAALDVADGLVWLTFRALAFVFVIVVLVWVNLPIPRGRPR